MRPFSSRSFFRNRFFVQQRAGASQTITINSVQVPAIVVEGLDPSRDGALMSRPGQWAEIAVFTLDYHEAAGESRRPAHGETWTTADAEYRVEGNGQLVGDAYVVKALANQRRLGGK